MTGDPTSEELLGGAFARAYAEAEARKAAAEEARRLKEEAEAAAALAEHVYDPLPYPEAEPADRALYEGTGVGALYGFPGSDRFLAELGDWRLAPRSEKENARR